MTGTEFTSMVGAVSRPTLFDARRGVYYPKPVLRGWLHLVWFVASLVTGTLLLAHADGARQITAVAIYAATVTGLFGTSALYHRGNWGPLASRWLQRLDHSMIFLLIAGTGTAAFLLTAPNPYAAIGLSVLCGLTLAAIVTHLVLDERAGEARRRDLHRSGLDRGHGRAGGVGGCGNRPRVPSAGRRRALHRRRAVLLPPVARPRTRRLRFPRSVPRLRLRGRDLPIHRHHPAHPLT